nr:uncharacterized protein CI109_006034 [Kwoniella shandongensis]KAA5525583.1 hypothetical protein CI109_006034 [Kwoniella shandongensis]
MSSSTINADLDNIAAMEPNSATPRVAGCEHIPKRIFTFCTTHAIAKCLRVS